jgi:hypothetical protein
MQKILSQRGTEPGDIMSEHPGDIISECPGDFVGIRSTTRRRSAERRRRWNGFLVEHGRLRRDCF